MKDTVWIPSVPLPFMYGWAERCACGKWFVGRNKRERYEIHWRAYHEEPQGDSLGEYPRDEAERIYAKVRALREAS